MKEEKPIKDTPLTLEVLWTEEKTPQFVEVSIVERHGSQGISITIDNPYHLMPLITALRILNTDIRVQRNIKERTG